MVSLPPRIRIPEDPEPAAAVASYEAYCVGNRNAALTSGVVSGVRPV